MEALERRFAQGHFGRFAPSATVTIEAPSELVWNVLVDFANYSAWNRFTPSVQCGGRLGDDVVMEVRFPGDKPIHQVEILNVFEPPHRLAWGVQIGISSILVANRYQQLDPLPGERTRYSTIDYVSGILAPIVRRLYEDKMRAGFLLAAEGLKTHCERLVHGR